MEHATLDTLLTALEKDRKVRICVIFHENIENPFLVRSTEHRSHASLVCKSIRKNHGGYQDCHRCRVLVSRILERTGKPICGCCPYGVYEYCSPVIYRDKVIGGIFIGNILRNDPRQLDRLGRQVDLALSATMERRYTDEDCRITAGIVSSYITLLLDVYGVPEHKQDALSDKIRHYILENYAFDISVSKIARAFGYNEKYLGRLFKKQTGQTIVEYCNSLRIHEAKKLLATTDLAVSEIAGLAGFNNITYFNYVFGNSTQMSPSQYRESAEAGPMMTMDS